MSVTHTHTRLVVRPRSRTGAGGSPYARHAVIALAALLISAGLASAQSIPAPTRSIRLDGPRLGITFMSPGVIDALEARQIHIRPVITQFGWQFEKQFYGTRTGLAAVTEVVGLLGGLEQSVAIPSLSWMVGIRTPGGAEFGVGPNITPAGTALAIAAGVTFRSGVLNVPVNVAVVPSKTGVRVSLLTGFNLRGRR
jgi:hypothetical protein